MLNYVKLRWEFFRAKKCTFTATFPTYLTTLFVFVVGYCISGSQYCMTFKNFSEIIFFNILTVWKKNIFQNIKAYSIKIPCHFRFQGENCSNLHLQYCIGSPHIYLMKNINANHMFEAMHRISFSVLFLKGKANST